MIEAQSIWASFCASAAMVFLNAFPAWNPFLGAGEADTTWESGPMKVKSSIERGAQYLCTKLGYVVTAIQQVAVVKGLAMWEVERKIGDGIRKRLIVSERSLVPPSISGEIA
ncbi:MAG: hypothetical protein WAR41_14450 [Azonexus sp.]|jgi:hypothetical protein